MSFWMLRSEFAEKFPEEVQGSSELACSDEGQASSGISCGMGGVAHRSPAGRRDEAVTGVEVVQCAAVPVVAQTGFPRSGWQRRVGASVQFVRRRPVGNSPC